MTALHAEVAYLADPVNPVLPSSDTARRIAGKAFIIEGNNALNLREFSVAFAEGKSDALAQAVSTDGAKAQIIVGLDNVYRQSPSDTTWRRGWWEDDHTFVLRGLDTGGIQEHESRFEFVGDEVRVHSEETTLGAYTDEFNGVLK